eukprot:TRINITY_DN4202_c1_g1_i2.p1 TRINITY_DN4202_c1_g1~~TRINITY_DN4202_c1_g1_i2.p1  ORF type:complete len:619 (-),score=138.97 TRINITY_DN4202_c1_g1_i2:12-1868(-)
MASSNLISLLIIIVFSVSIMAKKIYDVSLFGAIVDDYKDDTAALQAAIQAAIKEGYPNAVVQMHAGQYDVSNTLQIIGAHTSLTFAGVSATSTLLLYHGVTGVLNYEQSYNITISSFFVDFAPDSMPFTAGTIVDIQSSPSSESSSSSSSSPSSASPYSLDIKIVPPHTARAGVPAGAIFVYDVANKRPAFGPDTNELYQSGASPSIIINNGSSVVVRFGLVDKPFFKLGDNVVVRYDMGCHHAITGQDSSNVLIHGVTVYTSWCMTHTTLRVTDLHIVDYHVMPGPGRWLSSLADCMHFSDHRDTLSILDSSCAGMGDDGLNVHSFIFNTTNIINSTSAEISLTKSWTDTLNVGLGASMTFAHVDSPFLPFATYKIASYTQKTDTTFIYTFTSPITGVLLGDAAHVTTTNSLSISNFSVIANRARGVLVETRNVIIQRSLFRFTSGPALLFQPSYYWGEAEPGANVTITQNAFDGCNQGIAQQRGTITILPDPIQTMGVIQGLNVVSNTFLQGVYSGGLVQSYNANGLRFRDNYIANIGNSTSDYPFYICNSEDLTVAHNNAWRGTDNNRQGYVMDSTLRPCALSLSRGLSFSNDAFNATFTAPVMPAPSGYGVIVL